jgi:hypothetical protein
MELKETDIEALEHREAGAIVRKDLDALKELWSDKLIGATNANLILSKERLLRLIETGLFDVEILERSVTKTILHEHVAYIVGNERNTPRVGPHAGRIVAYSYLGSWVREQDGVWRLIARHLAPINFISSRF